MMNNVFYYRYNNTITMQILIVVIKYKKQNEINIILKDNLI